MAADRVIRLTTAVAVIAVAVVAEVAEVASYEHAYDLVRAHGEAGWTARLVPLTVDGLIYASSMVMLDCARRKVPVSALARWLLGLGITATLAANIAHGLGHGLTGAAVAAWPAVALVGSYELLMMIIRSARLPGTGTALGGTPGCMWGSHVPSGYAHTWPRSTARRRACHLNSRLPCPRFRRPPDGTARQAAQNIRRSVRPFAPTRASAAGTRTLR